MCGTHATGALLAWCVAVRLQVSLGPRFLSDVLFCTVYVMHLSFPLF